MLKATILTSVKGTGKWLEGMLVSALHMQGGACHEVIINANGEDEWDDVDEALKMLPGENIFVNYRRHALTLSRSLNMLSALSYTNLIMRLDPDDRLPTNALPRMIEMHEENGPDAVVYGDYRDFGAVNRTIKCKPATKRALWSHSVGPYNFLITRNLLKRAGGWAEIGYEDWNLYIRLMAAGGKPVPLNIITLFHRVRSGGRGAKFALDHEARLTEMHEANKEWFA